MPFCAAYVIRSAYQPISAPVMCARDQAAVSEAISFRTLFFRVICSVTRR